MYKARKFAPLFTSTDMSEGYQLWYECSLYAISLLCFHAHLTGSHSCPGPSCCTHSTAAVAPAVSAAAQPPPPVPPPAALWLLPRLPCVLQTPEPCPVLLGGCPRCLLHQDRWCGWAVVPGGHYRGGVKTDMHGSGVAGVGKCIDPINLVSFTT
jgi:hypothetical protein